jgi:acyl-CoA synthetase (AMP-forming)/AMP-acid ligase II
VNLASLLDRAGRVAGDAPAIAHGSTVWASYRELCARVEGLAGGLADSCSPDGRVALVMKNQPEYVEALFACWQAGVVAVPVNAKLHPSEIAHILEDSGAGMVLASSGLCEVAASAAAAVGRPPRIVEVGGADWRALCAGSAAHPRAAAESGDPAWLFYTSGTTGRPKGAVLSHRNLLAITLGYLADIETVATGDGLLHAAPMSHGSGLYILPFVAGMGLQIVPESGKFEPDEIFRLARVHQRVSLFAAPTMVRRMTAAALSDEAGRGLRTVVYGGGPMYVEDCKAALDRFGPRLAQIYGQGETPMTITVLPKRLLADRSHPRWEERLAGVGYAATPVEVRIAGPDDEALGAGEAGEVLVRGDTVMGGYWNMAQASAETLRGGWLHTGDIGAMDADGFLTLKDRAKDVIISGGSNIYPREVEEVLLRSAAVREVSVVGRPHPDWGEEVIAFVVVEPGQIPTPEALDALCNAHIARFKRPKRYRFVETLPKNEYGKVLKTELRRLALDPTP